jgi:predicted DNA-binding transcriptional regulator
MKGFKGFTIIANNIFEYNLPPIEIAMVLVLKEHMYGNKNQCNPSIGRIAKILGISYKTAWYHLHQLMKKGIIAIISGAKKGITNVYTFVIDIFVPSKKSDIKKELNKKEQPYQYSANSFKEKQHNAWYGYSQRKYNVDELERYLGLNH